MTTFEEQLDELVALAADAGRLGAEHAAAEKAREAALDRRRAGARARSARQAWERAERKLSGARARFLARHGSGARQNERSDAKPEPCEQHGEAWCDCDK